MNAPSFLFFAASEKMNAGSGKIFAQVSQFFQWMEFPVQVKWGKNARC